MNGGEIELHVEGIALAAMPAGGERHLREAIERELVRMVRQSGREWAPPGPPPGRPAQGRSEGTGRGADSVATRIGRDVHAHLSGRTGE